MERRGEASAPRLLLSPSEPLMYVKAAHDTLHYTCKVDLGLPPPGGRNVHLLSTSTRSGSIPSLEKANFEGIVQSNIDLWPLGRRRLTVVEFYVVKEILPAETLSSHSKKNSAGTAP